MTKIDVISGFLGAGKTTFIKKLLKEAISGEKVVLVENEFGQIGIDSGFLKDSGIEIKEMNSGCICCSLVGDFAASLREILTKYNPDRVIIEPSGVGKLSDVMKAVNDVEKELNINHNAIVTIVDAKKCKLYKKNFGEFFNNQIEHAKTIVLSRTDIATQEKIEEALGIIRTINKEADIITTPLNKLSGEKLLELLENPVNMEKELLDEMKKNKEHVHEHGECCGHHHKEHAHEHGECCGHHHEEHAHEHGECCGHHHEEHAHEHGECCGHHHEGHTHEHHHADEVFESCGIENLAPMSRAELEAILKGLYDMDKYGMVLRAKGMVPDKESDNWLHFDFVPGEMDIRYGASEHMGKVCVIGSGISENEIKKEFKR